MSRWSSPRHALFAAHSTATGRTLVYRALSDSNSLPPAPNCPDARSRSSVRNLPHLSTLPARSRRSSHASQTQDGYSSSRFSVEADQSAPRRCVPPAPPPPSYADPPSRRSVPAVARDSAYAHQVAHLRHPLVSRQPCPRSLLREGGVADLTSATQHPLRDHRRLCVGLAASAPERQRAHRHSAARHPEEEPQGAKAWSLR